MRDEALAGCFVAEAKRKRAFLGVLAEVSMAMQFRSGKQVELLGLKLLFKTLHSSVQCTSEVLLTIGWYRTLARIRLPLVLVAEVWSV